MKLLQRLVGRRSGRSLDAGAGGRRWEGTPALPNLNSAMEAAGASIRQRAAYFARNNAYARRAVNIAAANAVGTGIKPQSRVKAEGTRDALHTAFGLWSDQADATGRTDFYGLQSLLFRQLMEAGEGFVRFRWAEDRRGRPTVRLQVIAPDQVDPTMSRDLDGGHRIRAGVELDPDGRPIAYHVLPARPADMLAVSWTPVRVPASEMLHIMEVLEPGQVRGLSPFAAVLLRLQVLDKAEDAQLVRQMIAAMLAGFITDPNGDAAGFEGERYGSILETGLEPGTLKTVPPGYDIKFSTPAEVGDGAEFLKGQLRAVAAGLDVTYEQLTGDLSGVNYSSIRAGLIEFRQRVEVLRWNVLIPQLCRPVWERFIQLQVLRGEVPAADFDRDPDTWLAADWFPPGWSSVDPVKDVQAETAAVEAGFKARSQVINERGEDPERVDALRAADKERAKRLGLERPSSQAPAPGEPSDDGSSSPSAVPADGSPTPNDDEDAEKEADDAED